MTIHPFHSPRDHHRSAMTWRMVLDSASNEHDVVQAARDFIASFTPHEIELMPEGCRPGKLVDGDDIAGYSYDLATHRGEADKPGAALVEAFASFFADALQRLALVSSFPAGGRESA
jgi:hypothetical protein